jgi:hypothetical protein
LALSDTFSIAVLVPVAAGLNVTLTVQLAPEFSVPPQVVADSAKSPALVPVKEKPLRVNVVARLFVTVTVLAALVVPTVWLA